MVVQGLQALTLLAPPEAAIVFETSRCDAALVLLLR